MIKKILTNKNLVTVLAIIVLFVILFFYYSKRVNDSINPTIVPYAKVEIASGIQITKDMVGTTSVSPSMLRGDVIESQSDVVGKYSNADTIIPKGSLFYRRNVVEKEALPANIILDYKEGYVLYNMSVSVESTYGNSIYPGNYIDIYLKAQTKSLTGDNDASEKKVVLGKFIENVQVIAVKDSTGRPVFQELDEERTPAMIVFAVPEEYYVLLKKAEYLRTYKSELIPVPTNESLKNEPGDINISSESLKDWINSVTVWTDM